MTTLQEKYPLESRKPLKKTIAGIWHYFFIAFFIGIYLYFEFGKIFFDSLNNFWTIFYFFIGITIIIFVLKYIYEVYYMKYYFYDLVGKNLIIKKEFSQGMK